LNYTFLEIKLSSFNCVDMCGNAVKLLRDVQINVSRKPQYHI